MADKIEFPLNDEVYLKQAKEYLKDEAYNKALELIKKINHESVETNYIHSLILFGLNEFEEALEVLNRYKNIFISDEKYAFTYVLLLIKNHLFVEAEALIIENSKNELSPFYAEWQLLNKELDVERDSYNQEVEKRKKEVLYGLQNLENLSVNRQITLIEDARLLELYDLQPIAQEILTDFHISPLNQRAFLELLIEKKDDQMYHFYWLGEMKELVPKECNRFGDVPAVEIVVDILSSKLEKEPQFIDSIYTEMINDLLLLFPFIEEVIIDPEYWVNLYLEQFKELHLLDIKAEPYNESEKKMKDWYTKMSQLSNRQV